VTVTGAAGGSGPPLPGTLHFRFFAPDVRAQLASTTVGVRRRDMTATARVLPPDARARVADRTVRVRAG
jgi:hypothetical protein